MTYYITRGRTVLCRHVDGTQTGFIYANTEQGKLDLPPEWEAIGYETREEASLFYDINEREWSGARVLTKDALLGGASYCGHTQDLFAGVQP